MIINPHSVKTVVASGVAHHVHHIEPLLSLMKVRPFTCKQLVHHSMCSQSESIIRRLAVLALCTFFTTSYETYHTLPYETDYESGNNTKQPHQ
jgi:hypothetical protein